MFWALEDSSRFLLERMKLEELCGEVSWINKFKWGIAKNVLLKVEIDLLIGEKIYEVELIYPKLFPDTPAYVLPRSSTERWSSHQYGAGGVLCLEWGPDNWQPEITGADLLQSTYKLLTAESVDTTSERIVPSRHSLTYGQEVRASIKRLVITSALADFFQGLVSPYHSEIQSRCIFHNSALVLFISEILCPDGESYRPSDLPKGITQYFPLFSLKQKGWLFKSDTFDSKVNILNMESLLELIRGGGFKNFEIPPLEEGKPNSTEYFFILIGPNQTVRAFTSDIYREGKVIENTLIVTQDSPELRLPQEYLAILNKKIGVVGLGSVGSKVVISLARSGANNFLLIDDDVMHQANVCRHELDWGFVGVNKVEALKEALSLIANDIDVQVRSSRIAGQESSESASTALEALATCDILIDATASSSVFVQLSAVAKRRNIPLVWGEVFAGGIGAILVRSRPEKDLDPLNMRAAVYSYLQTLPKAPFIRSTNYDVLSELGQPLIASDSEVTQFASVFTRFAVDILLGQTHSEFPYSAYLIGFKKAWIFEAPFDTRPINMELTSTGAVKKPSDQLDNKQAVEIITALIDPEIDADTDSSS